MECWARHCARRFEAVWLPEASFCPSEKGGDHSIQRAVVRESHASGWRGSCLEQLSCSLPPVFNSSRSASPWATAIEGHRDNPSLSFGVDQGRRNSMSGVFPRAHPPPTHCAQDVESQARTSLTPRSLCPSPSGSIQNRLKGTGFPSCLSGECLCRDGS